VSGLLRVKVFFGEVLDLASFQVPCSHSPAHGSGVAKGLGPDIVAIAQEPIRILGKGRAGRLAAFLFLIGLMADEEESSTMQGLWRN
jgi:hypothetical protein